MSYRDRTAKFYFGLRSPYSWLAYLDLLGRYPAVAHGLEWIPFWEPDELTLRLLTEAGGRFTYVPMSRPKHLYVLQDMRRLTAARGLSFRWPVDRSPRWEVPHAAYLVAAEHGRGREFLDLAHHARWRDGADICDPDVVGGFAGQLGLAPAALAGAADDPAVRAAGVRALLSAYRDGVFGVPFFIRGSDRYWGVERLAEFVRALDTGPAPVAARDRRAVTGNDRSADGGHAGGCG